MLSFNQLTRNLKRDCTGFRTLKVALVGDSATQLLAKALRGMSIERSFQMLMFEAEYNQVERMFLDTTSELYQQTFDYVILFQSTHHFALSHAVAEPSARNRMADERLAFIEAATQSVTEKGAHIIVMNYPEFDDSVFGNYADKLEGSLLWQTRRLNMGLMEMASRLPLMSICDVASLQSQIGRSQLFDSHIYVSTEMVLSVDALPFVASRLMDIICAYEGYFKKCLILDLDNTLWGGVIGDDGLEGIQLGHGLGIGKAFTEFQIWIKKLKQRGIIICVVSKNDEETAKEAFEKHPEMVLKLDDIAVFQANWETKVDNIRTIQSILNIGFDSMVFLDDNPFERNMVRENIPDITVPELPEDPGEYLEYLYSLNLFETASYSQADKDRTKQYQVEAQRVSLQKTFENEADFLKSLNMASTVSGFNKYNTPRVAQLSQRSNQFNLRTIRYTEADIEALAQDPDVIDLCFTLEDKFGDNGLIAVVIMKRQDDETLFVETWFMSCRVLKRGMENYTLNQMVDRARKAGYQRIIGEYLPTAKNKMVEQHYTDLGFQPLENTSTARYVLDISQYKMRECFITTKES